MTHLETFGSFVPAAALPAMRHTPAPDGAVDDERIGVLSAAATDSGGEIAHAALRFDDGAGRGAAIRSPATESSADPPEPGDPAQLQESMRHRATSHINVGAAGLAHAILMPLALFGAACTSSVYRGESAAPSPQVEVFHSESQVARPYQVMGTITTNAPAFMSEASIEMELVNQAKHRGADAIVVDSVRIETVGFRTTDPAGGMETYTNAKDTAGDTAADAKRVPIQEKAASARLLRYTG